MAEQKPQNTHTWYEILAWGLLLDVALKNEYCSTAVTALRYLLKIRPSDVVSHTVIIKNLWAWCRHTYALATQSRWKLILIEFQISASLHNHVDAHISFLSCQHGIRYFHTDHYFILLLDPKYLTLHTKVCWVVCLLS